MAGFSSLYAAFSDFFRSAAKKASPLLGKAKRVPWLFCLSAVFLAISLGTVLYYILGPSEGFWHSDCTDSLYWANATVESGKIIADNYRYAALLPFSANLWMIPLIHMFGFTVRTQLISMVIFALLLTASYVFVCRAMRFSWTLSFTATGCLLMLLSGSVKLREILWEHVIYYSLALLLFNCLLGLLLKFLQSLERYRTDKSTSSLVYFGVWFGLFCLLSTASSTNGFQLIMMTTLPLLVAVFLDLLFATHRKLLCKENLGRFAALLALPLCSLLGLTILDALRGEVTAGYTNYYTAFATSGKWSENLLKLPGALALLFGFQDTGVVLTEKEGIFNLLRIGVLLLLLIVPLVALFFTRHFRFRETKILLFSHIALSAALLFLWICGNISNANWRLVPLIGFAALSTFAVVRELAAAWQGARKEAPASSTAPDGGEGQGSQEKSRKASAPSLPLRLATLLLSVLLLFSISNQRAIRAIPADYGRDNTVHKLTDVLLENNLSYGYATFWYSQAITLLSDSQVKCREILAANQQDGAKTDYYQSSYDWYAPQEGVEEYFILLTAKEYTNIRQNENWKRWVKGLTACIDTVPGFYIFVFNEYPEGIR